MPEISIAHYEYLKEAFVALKNQEEYVKEAAIASRLMEVALASGSQDREHAIDLIECLACDPDITDNNKVIIHRLPEWLEWLNYDLKKEDELRHILATHFKIIKRVESDDYFDSNNYAIYVLESL